MAQPAPAIQYRQLEPGIVGAKPGGPDHGIELTVCQVQFQGRDGGNTGGRWPLRRVYLTGPALLLDPGIDATQQSAHFQVRQPGQVSQGAGTLRVAPPDSRQPAHQAHTTVGKCIQVQVRLRGATRQLRGRQPPGPANVVHLPIALIQNPGNVHPEQNIPAPVTARHTHMFADRHGYRSPRALYLIGDLQSTGGSADHQHPTVGQLAGIAIFVWGQTQQARWQVVGQLRNQWNVKGAAGDHQSTAIPFSTTGFDAITRFQRKDAGHPGPGLDRRRDCGGIVTDKFGDLGHGQKAIWIMPPVRIIWQAVLPVGSE